MEAPGGGADTLDFSEVGGFWEYAIGAAVRVGRPGFKVVATGLEDLIGSAGIDRYRFEAGARLAGTIDGGPGYNGLDYGPYRTPVAVDLAIGAATGTAGVSNINDVTGGAGDDLLVGDGRDNVLSGNGGRDVLIGGGGQDYLIGGAGQDLIVGNPTAFDTDPTGLALIRAEWTSRSAFEVRRTHLLGEAGGGRNGPAVVTGTTVHADGVSDTLGGGPGQDWLVLGTADTYFSNGQPGEETVTVF